MRRPRRLLRGDKFSPPSVPPLRESRACERLKIGVFLLSLFWQPFLSSPSFSLPLADLCAPLKKRGKEAPEWKGGERRKSRKDRVGRTDGRRRMH